MFTCFRCTGKYCHVTLFRTQSSISAFNFPLILYAAVWTMHRPQLDDLCKRIKTLNSGNFSRTDHGKYFLHTENHHYTIDMFLFCLHRRIEHLTFGERSEMSLLNLFSTTSLYFGFAHKRFHIYRNFFSSCVFGRIYFVIKSAQKNGG